MENKLVVNACENGYKKLYQSYSVDNYKKEIQEKCILKNSNYIELNITSCRLGYPSTPRFIDIFLEHLSKLTGEKTLIIKMGCISYFEWVCLNIIVLEGKFFGVSEKINSAKDLGSVKKIINNKLNDNNIHMIIKLNNAENTVFDYGKE